MQAHAQNLVLTLTFCCNYLAMSEAYEVNPTNKTNKKIKCLRICIAVLCISIPCVAVGLSVLAGITVREFNNLTSEFNNLASRTKENDMLIQTLMNDRETDANRIEGLTEKLNSTSRELSDLQQKYDAFVASPQEFVEMKVNNLREELTDTILSFHHLAIQNATTLTNRLSQDTNASIGEIILQLEGIARTLDQRITSVNQTFTNKNVQIETQLFTQKDRLHELKTETQTNISNIQSSFNEYKSQQAKVDAQQNESISSIMTVLDSGAGSIGLIKSRLLPVTVCITFLSLIL